MKSKQYQRIECVIPSGQNHVNIKEQLRPDYKYATGLFFFSDRSTAGITCGLKIDGNEILPIGSEVSLFKWSEGISRNDALWDFSDDKIESAEKTIDIHFDLDYEPSQDTPIYLMVLLKN